MELWVRNQDKDHLVKIEEINIEIDEDGFIGIWSYGSNKYLKYYLGTYKTKERALKVLDEIQEVKLGNFHYNCPSNVKVSNDEDTIVYEMPKE